MLQWFNGQPASVKTGALLGVGMALIALALLVNAYAITTAQAKRSTNSYSAPPRFTAPVFVPSTKKDPLEWLVPSTKKDPMDWFSKQQEQDYRDKVDKMYSDYRNRQMFPSLYRDNRSYNPIIGY